MDSMISRESDQTTAPASDLSPAGARLASDGLIDDLKFRIKRKNGTYKEIPVPDPALEFPLADVHCHLSMLGARDFALARAAAYGIDFICCVTDVAEDAGSSYRSVDDWRVSAAARLSAMAEDESLFVPSIKMACGCHPHNAKEYDSNLERALLRHLSDGRTCALGEIGLDYHYDLSPRDVQRKVFRRQIDIAHRTGLPVQLHVREAHDDAFAILDEMGFPEAGVLLHCFNLGPAEAERWLDRGCYLSVGGAVTFASSDDLREAVKMIPANRLLIETDAPYMTPAPLRGCENGPEYTIFTAAKIAEVRGCSSSDKRQGLLRAMHENAMSLFDRDATLWQTSER